MVGTFGTDPSLTDTKSFNVDLTLPLGVDNDIAGDDTINIAEKASGFTISGSVIDSLSDADDKEISGVTVVVTIGSTALTGTSSNSRRGVVGGCGRE